jgi:1-phosphofructokinase family hexose kinase
MLLTVTLNPALDVSLEVPGWEVGEVNRARRVLKSAGGKGINMARVLRELGDPATAVTILGSDSVQEFRRLAREAAVPIIYINIPGEIRTNTHLVDPIGGRVLKVNQPGVHVLPSYFQHFELLYRQQLKTSRMVALAGSLPPGLGADSWARLVRWANAVEVPAIVDAEGPPLREALAERPFLAKPNRKELEGTLGRELPALQDLVEGAEEVIRLGARNVMVTNGGEPGVAIADGQVYLLHPPPLSAVEVKGTTGSGDASAAGLMSGLARNAGWEESLRLAMACGAACCLTPEGQLVRRKDVDRLRERARVTLHRRTT